MTWAQLCHQFIQIDKNNNLNKCYTLMAQGSLYEGWGWGVTIRMGPKHTGIPCKYSFELNERLANNL